MFNLKSIALTVAAGALLAAPAFAPAQISIGIGGGAPVCPYGYYDYAPYNCSPYGYYGPDWFNSGIFIGAGPWYHGGHGFYGHVDNRYDPHYGYHGPFPDRNDRPFEHFHGNEARDGQGHIGRSDHDAFNEHSGGFSGHGAPGGESHGYSHDGHGH